MNQKIYDGFIFNDELELLELRLLEIGDMVDAIVLAEAPYNWQKKEKPLFYDENKNEFKRWHDKIRHVIVDDIPIGEPPVMEWNQRRAVARGMEDAEMTDYIMYSDADEIPSREAIRAVRSWRPSAPIALMQKLYYHYVNFQKPAPWCGTVVRPRGLDTLDFEEIRSRRWREAKFKNGGWHFSWLGSVEDIQYKLRCHTIEWDSRSYPAGDKFVIPDADDAGHIQACLDGESEFFKRDGHDCRLVEIKPGTGHPEEIEGWLERHPHLKRVSVTA